MLDWARFYGFILCFESNGDAFLDCRDRAGRYSGECRVCSAFEEGRRITEADIDAKTNGNVELLDHFIGKANVDLT